MPIEIVFVALAGIRQVSHLPEKQIPATVERIKALRTIVKSNHPNAMCIFSWHEDSICGMNSSHGQEGISLSHKETLINEMLKLTQDDPDLHIFASAIVDKPIKSFDELKKIRDLYTLHYDIRDEEIGNGYVSRYNEHENHCLNLMEQPHSPQQKKRSNSCYYFHQNQYIRHDKRAPFAESYNPHIIWQPPKKNHVNSFVTIHDPKTNNDLDCQLAICREFYFLKRRMPLMIIMSHGTPRDSVMNTDLAEVIFHVEHFGTYLYISENIPQNKYAVVCYENNVSKASVMLKEIAPTYLEKPVPELPKMDEGRCLTTRISA